MTQVKRQAPVGLNLPNFVFLLSRTGFLPGFFSGAESIVIQISFVMLIFLLFSDQISGGGGKSVGGWQTVSGGAPAPC